MNDGIASSQQGATATPAPGAAAAGEGQGTPGSSPQQSNVNFQGSMFQAVQPQAEPQASTDMGGEEMPALTFKERPAWLSEKFWDKTTGNVQVQQLAEGYEHFRTIVAGKGHQVPQSPDGYKIEIADDNVAAQSAAEVLIQGDDDPVLQSVRKAAHSAGISKAQFNAIVSSFLEAQGQILPEPVDIQAEVRKLGPKGPQIIKAQLDLINQHVQTGYFTPEEAQMIGSWLTNAREITVMRKLLEIGGVVPHIDLQATQMAAASPDAASLNARVAEVMKMQPGPARDRAWEDVQEGFRRLYGTDQTRSSVPVG